MTVLWIVIAAFLAGALLLILPGLWRAPAVVTTTEGLHDDQLREAERDVAAGLLPAEQIDAVRDEIARRAREDAATDATRPPAPARRSALAIAVALPAACVALYLVLGRPEAAAPSAPSTADTRHGVTPEQIQQMVTALAERLKANPNDAEGWAMLARSYTVLGRYRDAATAFKRAAELVPGDPNLLADLADVLAMTQGRKLAGEPAQWIQKALDLDPRHTKALALAGTAAFETKDYASARNYWQRLLAAVPADSALARSVQGSIAEATALDGAGAAVKPAPADGAAAPSAISGQVEIAPALAARVAAGDTLFVFARAAEGPRLPLAIFKRGAQPLPAAFTLDDSMAMSPQARLSGAASVVVGARISRSGNATPQPGDILGQSEPVRPGASGLRIVMDRVQP